MLPRPEYPRPQFSRNDWLNLNGTWEFEIDHGDTGLERGLLERELTGRIVVPFCPESNLSGVGYTDFMDVVWYRRQVEIPQAWTGRRVLLHFGAVDYDATVWVNGVEVYRHRGGFTPFTCDLYGVAEAGTTATIVVRARDDSRERQPRGKQAEKLENYGCFYTRTTGIWQTVWLEPVPVAAYLQRPRITPDVANGAFRIDQPIAGSVRAMAGLQLRVTLLDSAGVVTSALSRADVDFSGHVDLPIPPDRRHLWEPGNPHLYDLEIELLDDGGGVIDRARSYAGLRSVAIEGRSVKLNGKPVFQRLVLDQGFYPGGILTAPTDEALMEDIKLSMEAGFNGARLHQKVFEERFLYHADRMGYLCWGEFADFSPTRIEPRRLHHGATPTYITQWIEALQRDYSHPCIIGWCGMNETREPVLDRITTLDDAVRGMFLAAKAMDPTRPVLDTSGYSHRVQESDVWDSHDYASDADKLKGHIERTLEGTFAVNDNLTGSVMPTQSIRYRGQPFFVSEFGGIWWNPDEKEGEKSWGYGECPASIEEWYTRFERQCAVQLENPNLFGYCYTQLTDVFQEQNGIYTFDRRPKFDLARIRKAQLGAV